MFPTRYVVFCSLNNFPVYSRRTAVHNLYGGFKLFVSNIEFADAKSFHIFVFTCLFRKKFGSKNVWSYLISTYHVTIEKTIQMLF